MKRFFAILSWMLAFAIPAQAAAPQAILPVTVVTPAQDLTMLPAVTRP